MGSRLQLNHSKSVSISHCNTRLKRLSSNHRVQFEVSDPFDMRALAATPTGETKQAGALQPRVEPTVGALYRDERIE